MRVRHSFVGSQLFQLLFSQKILFHALSLSLSLSISHSFLIQPLMFVHSKSQQAGFLSQQAQKRKHIEKIEEKSTNVGKIQQVFYKNMLQDSRNSGLIVYFYGFEHIFAVYANEGGREGVCLLISFYIVVCQNFHFIFMVIQAVWYFIRRARALREISFSLSLSIARSRT